jgi:hypothetical protein
MTNYFNFKSIKVLEKLATGFKILCKLESNKLTKEIEFEYYRNDIPQTIINDLKANVNIIITNEKDLVETIRVFNNINTRIISISNINS